VNASERFNDPEWDGEPVEPIITGPKPPDYEPKNIEEPEPEFEKRKKIKIKLRDGKEKEISYRISITFMSPDGKPMTLQEFLNSLYGKLPELFTSEEELVKIWSNPLTRKTLLEKLVAVGFGMDELSTLQKIIEAEKSDLFDVLEYISFSKKPITREKRVANAQENIFTLLNRDQKEFLEFILDKYIDDGVEELSQEKLPDLLELKYQAISDAEEKLGDVAQIRKLFIEFQKHLYGGRVA